MNDKINLSVEGFDDLPIKDCELYLEIGPNSYSYAVINPTDKSVKAIAYKPSIVYNDVNDALLQSTFAKTKISLQTQQFTFIPSEIYKDKDLENYSKYLQASEKEKVATQSLEKDEITLIYALPKLYLDKLEAAFPNAQIFPQIAPFYSGITYAFSQIGFSQLFINIKNTFVEIIIINNHKFQFYNIFEFQNEEELMYYILLAIQQNKINTTKVTVKVSGQVDQFGDIFKKINQQFPRTEVTDQDSLPLFYNGLNHPAMPRFFSLLSLSLCE